MKRMSVLLASSQLALLAALAPAFAQSSGAVDPAVAASYQNSIQSILTYEADANADSAAAADSARAALIDACAALGTPDLAVCFDAYLSADMRFGDDVGLIYGFAYDPNAFAPQMEETPIAEQAPIVEEAPVVDEQPQEVAPVEQPVESVEAEPEPEVMVEQPVVEQPIEQVVEQPVEQVIEQVTEQPIEQVVEQVVEQVIEQVVEPVVEVVTEPAAPVEEPVAAEEEAPVLDSAKEAPIVDGGNADTAQQPVVEAPAAPAPTTDEEAQSEEVRNIEITSVEEEQGQQIDDSTERAIVEQQITAAPAQAQVVETNPIDLRVVLNFNNQLIIRNRDDERLNYNAEQVYQEVLTNGRTRTTVVRADGTRVVTIFNRNGDILNRSLFAADGTEYVMVYTPEDRAIDLLEWRDPALDLPPLRLTIPLSEYVLDVSRSEPQQVVQFLDQPPVEQITRLYSIDEVKRSARIRDTVRRLEISDLTFESGSANLGTTELSSLQNVALAMHEMLRNNPAEVFLIEGHTDAVGSELANLRLSDLRAETVAVALTRLFGIPPENLTTQGYGERYLKVRTEASERANRRVTIKRITPLISPLG